MKMTKNNPTKYCITFKDGQLEYRSYASNMFVAAAILITRACFGFNGRIEKC